MSTEQLSKQKPIAQECEDSDDDSSGSSGMAKFSNLKGKLGNMSDSEDECEQPIGSETPSSTSQIGNALPATNAAPATNAGAKGETKKVGTEVASSSSAVDSKSATDKKTKQATSSMITKKFMFEFAASPSELQKNPAARIQSYGAKDAKKFQTQLVKKVGSEMVVENVGVPSKATLHKMKICAGKNLHGVTIGLRIKGITGGVHTNTHDEPFLVTAEPGKDLTFETGNLAHHNQDANNPLVKQFGNTTMQQIDDSYALMLSDRTKCHVVTTSPIAKAAMNKANKKMFAKYGSMVITDSEGKVKPEVTMDTSDVLAIVAQLKSVVANLPVIDMTNLKAEIFRVDGRAFDDPNGVVGIMVNALLNLITFGDLGQNQSTRSQRVQQLHKIVFYHCRV